MATPASPPNLREYSVGELAGAVKRTVEDTFGLVRVRGELSGAKRHSSGHLYFSLKDDSALIDGVAWRNTAARLSFRPEDGLEVIVTGRLTTYPGRSRYQIVAEAMEVAGAGALLAMIEERRRRLAAEGLFAQERKRPLPFLPGVIGVVTSLSGAVIRDILHRLADRFPRHVLIWPAAMQGDGAAEQVAAAIAGFNAIRPGGPVPRPDVLIVARGGGSLEDLMEFNEEVVVRAAAASTIPLIAAIGHETDTTLIDHAADRRAPTPTAAAEMAVPVRTDLMRSLAELGHRLDQAQQARVEQRRERVAALARALRRPEDLLGPLEQRFDALAERLPRALLARVGQGERALGGASAGLRPRLLSAEVQRLAEALAGRSRALEQGYRRRLDERGARLDAAARLLDSLGYGRVLARGYAVVRQDGRILRHVAQAVPGALDIELADGHLAARVAGDGAADTAPRPAGPEPARADPPRRTRKAPRDQGDLF
ncbi:exodeoxyribonuclease VII large subunit [Zavarzinia sp. CC-PAN008]|uniref:exodeoxyribonuclease VII large subunit n=1 Tax=Zavarzinia sp. CC-PAN008 TaxID=3243332 RepID=UPI003F746D07